MSKQPESRLVKKIFKRLRTKYGGFWFKVWGGPFQQAGLPDIIGCVNGLFIGIEVKIPGKKPSALQLETIKDIEAAGGTADWADTVEDADELVAHALGLSKGSSTSKSKKTRVRVLHGTRNRKDPHNLSVIGHSPFSKPLRLGIGYLPSKRDRRMGRRGKKVLIPIVD